MSMLPMCIKIGSVRTECGFGNFPLVQKFPLFPSLSNHLVSLEKDLEQFKSPLPREISEKEAEMEKIKKIGVFETPQSVQTGIDILDLRKYTSPVAEWYIFQSDGVKFFALTDASEEAIGWCRLQHGEFVLEFRDGRELNLPEIQLGFRERRQNGFPKPLLHEKLRAVWHGITIIFFPERMEYSGNSSNDGMKRDYSCYRARTVLRIDGEEYDVDGHDFPKIAKVIRGHFGKSIEPTLEQALLVEEVARGLPGARRSLVDFCVSHALVEVHETAQLRRQKIEEGDVLRSIGCVLNFSNVWCRLGGSGNGGGWVISPDGSLVEPSETRFARAPNGARGETKSWDVVYPDELALRWKKQSMKSLHCFEVVHRPECITSAQKAQTMELLEKINSSWKGDEGDGWVDPETGENLTPDYKKPSRQKREDKEERQLGEENLSPFAVLAKLKI